MPSDRRDFLRIIGGGSMFAAAGAPMSLHAERTSHPAPLDDKWDVSWTDRVQGKFRGVFDSPEVSEGAGLYRAIFWMDQYKTVYGTARSDMSPVLVLRHSAIPLVMGDEYWKRYKVGKEHKLRTMEGKKWAEANPIRVAPPGTPPSFANYNLEQFMKDGGIVLACNLAFADLVGTVAKGEKLEKDAARARAISYMIPGIILQPSGVFAVMRAQQAGCHYMMAS